MGLFSDLSDLAEMEHEDEELVPEILPVDARLSVKGQVSKLLALFERAAAVSPTKETIPGTLYSLLEAEQSSGSTAAFARITASDGEQSISVVVDGLTVLMAGSVLVPAKRILDILKLVPSATVTLEVIGSAAIIRSGRAQWTVQTPVGDALDTLPDVADIEVRSVPVGPFLSALVAARKAASVLSNRASLMQLLVRDGTVTGCDGGRLHRAYIEGLAEDIHVTIPVKAVDELVKALRATESQFFEMGYDDRNLVFRIDQDTLTSHRMLLPFPDVEGLLMGPAFSNSNSLTVNTSELANSIKRIRINADPDYAGIFLGLIPGKKDAAGQISWSLAVRTRDRLGNTSQEVIECQWVGSNTARELCFNHHYLSDLLAAYGEESVVFRMGDDTKTVKTPLLLEDKTTGFSGIVPQMTMFWIK